MADPAVSSSQLSWQSAFWALIPLALNSMTQPSGMIFEFPSKYGFALRSSPIICGIDVLLTLILYTFTTIALRSPRAAAIRLTRHRFRDTPDGAEGSLASLQENTILRIAVLILGALPQAVKLYAVRGLLWTKVWGSAFLSSFLILELLLSLGREARPARGNLLGHPRWTSRAIFYADPHEIPVLEKISAVLALFGSVTFSVYFIAIALSQHAEQYMVEPHRPESLNTLPIQIMYVLMWSVVVVATIPNPRLGTLTTLSFLPMTCLWIVLAENTYIYAVESSIVFVLGCTACATHILRHIRPAALAHYIHYGLGTYFMLLLLSPSLLYYSIKYDPAGTSKPSWTDQLG